ncbi:MAG: NUDIX hydrolase [Candidatus Micrarchaeia archaeon]
MKFMREEEVKLIQKKFAYNGREYIRKYIETPETVCIVAVLKNKKIILEKQYRQIIKKTIIEIPAGKLRHNESPKNGALRELEEETGYKAMRIKYLFSAYASPGFSNEIMHYFLADKLKKTKTNRDFDETIKLIEVDIKDAIKLIKTGKIKNSTSIAGILYYTNFKL